MRSAPRSAVCTQSTPAPPWMLSSPGPAMKTSSPSPPQSTSSPQRIPCGAGARGCRRSVRDVDDEARRRRQPEHAEARLVAQAEAEGDLALEVAGVLDLPEVGAERIEHRG